jgi:hypothetical protein
MPSKCIFDLCNIVPSYNKSGEKSPIYCLQHKSPEMINVRPRHKPKCIYADCTTTPLFNCKGEKIPLYCAIHKKEGMIDVIHKICEEPNCKSLPCPHSPFFKSDKVTLKKLKLSASYFPAVLLTVLQND